MEIGARREIGSFSFTTENIKNSPRNSIRSAFNLDRGGGGAIAVRGIGGVGWAVVGSVCMNCWSPTGPALDEGGRRRAARRSWGVGPSPGFRELRWIRPVLPATPSALRAWWRRQRTSEKRSRWGILQERPQHRRQHSARLGISRCGDRVRAATERGFLKSTWLPDCLPRFIAIDDSANNFLLTYFEPCPCHMALRGNTEGRPWQIGGSLKLVGL